MSRKIKKKQQKEDVKEVQERDLFQTPNYATELLLPFLLKVQHPHSNIWECACGEGKMVNVLQKAGLKVIGTDLAEHDMNFLTDRLSFPFWAIVTNPPFSLKRKFYEMCNSYYQKEGVAFALLIPADYSGWVIKAVQDGAEKIIPTRRIDYITPHTLKRIHEGEIWKLYKDESDYKDYKNLRQFKEERPTAWGLLLSKHIDHHNYESIYTTPTELLREYSSSDFHSIWLTKGLNLGKTETFVELTNEMKSNI